jgi:hypothetical protein
MCEHLGEEVGFGSGEYECIEVEYDGIASARAER